MLVHKENALVRIPCTGLLKSIFTEIELNRKDGNDKAM